MLTKKIEIPKISSRAEFLPESINEETRSFDVIVTTEKPVLRGFFSRFYEVLEMKKESIVWSRLEKGAPFLAQHGSGSIFGSGRDALADQIGIVERAWLDGNKMMANIRLSKNHPDADRIWGDIKDGILRNISVGYIVHKYGAPTKKDPNDEKEIPTRKAILWEPAEVSLVTVPADENSHIKSARSQNQSELYECEFIESKQEDSSMFIKKHVPMDAATDGGSGGGSTGASAEDLKKAEELGQKKEQTRQNEIRSAVKAAKLGEDFAQKLIDQNVSIDEARKLIIDEWQKSGAPAQKPNNADATITRDESDKFREGASEWLMQRSGSAVVKMVEEQTGKKIDGGEFRGMSLIDIARECLERAGVKTRGMDKMTLVGQAFTYRGGAYHTTSDFPIILENALHKVLLGAYATTPDSWSRFCKKGTVSDFRAHPRYRLGSFGKLDSLNEHGEFKNKSIPDAEKSSITAGTKGNIIGISRQSIVNDDMGAFNDLATRFGRAAKLSIEIDVYDLLKLNSGLGPTQADGQALFHANRNNVNATGSALSAAGLDADRVVMASQKDPSGNEILDLRPSILVVPIGLGGQAKVINASTYDPDTVANKAQMKPNIALGMFNDIVDTARLSGTRRYLFADPAIAPVIEVAFLDGQENPFLEAKEGWRVDGVEWKVRLDYGVADIDFRGAVTNAGA